MTTERALDLALEALAIADNIALVGVAYTPKSIDLGLLKIRGARDAIKQARSVPVQKRPQNCGTGYCSCVECVMEPAPVQEPVAHGVNPLWLATHPDKLTTPPAQPAATLTEESVFIAVSNYRRKRPDGKKDRTPHYDGVSWLHSIIGVSRTKEGAERMAKAAEEAYRDTFPAYRTPGWDPIYVWEVEERANSAPTPPAQPAPVQEPVGNWIWSWLMDWCKRNGIAPATQDSLFAMVKDARSKFESTPPAAQRQWVGLTDEEMDNFVKAVWGRGVTAADFIRAIEAKLKETQNGN
jgi:hypothetical protein